VKEMKNAVVALVAAFAMMAVFSCAKEKDKEQVLESGKAAAGDAGYTYKITVDKMQFNWKAEASGLSVKLKAPTTGWLSAGFNPTQGMKDANFIIGLIKDGKAVITDQHGIDLKQHRKDTDLGGDDNIRNPAGSEMNNETEISFVIPLKSPDSLDKPITVNGDTVVLLAYGQTKQMAQQHVMWARATVNLSTGAYTVNLLKRLQ
jgi:hypothetical protein